MSHCTAYFVIGKPPLFNGAFHDIRMRESLNEIIVTEVGPSGRFTGVIGDGEARTAKPKPLELRERMRKK